MTTGGETRDGDRGCDAWASLSTRVNWRAGWRGRVLPRCGFEDFEDSLCVLAPLGGFGAELFSAGGGELVVLGSAVVLGQSPLRFDELFALEAVECLIERGVFDGQHFIGALADPPRDGVAMHRFPGEGLQDE